MSSSIDTNTPKAAPESGCSKCGRIITRTIFGVLFVTGLAVGLSYIWTGSPNPADYFVPVDPPGLTEAIRWDAESGLDLLVENACDDTWTTSFDRTIVDWEQTDALSLTTQKVPHDPDCSARFGALKACNGDYGKTNWRGINTSVLRNDLIAYSTSKLNDFHLKTADEKLYTMCHEMGHGFGLPHTDEDHFNRDRGECMDYTNRPGRNLVPGEFNLNLLVEMYGTPTVSRGSAALEATDQGNEQMNPQPTPTNQRPAPSDEKDKKEKEDRSRMLRGGGSDTQRTLATLQEIDTLVKGLEESCEAEYCSVDLGEGYRVEIHKLLV